MFAGAILEFEHQDAVFLNDNYKEIISIPAIRLIETSNDQSCNPGCAFDIHAYVPQVIFFLTSYLLFLSIKKLWKIGSQPYQFYVLYYKIQN